MAGEPQQQPLGTARERIGESTGDAIRRVYPPDAAADDVLDRLIDQLGQVPWPKKGRDVGDARH